MPQSQLNRISKYIGCLDIIEILTRFLADRTKLNPPRSISCYVVVYQKSFVLYSVGDYRFSDFVVSINHPHNVRVTSVLCDTNKRNQWPTTIKIQYDNSSPPDGLTRCGLVTHICVRELDYCWLSKSLTRNVCEPVPTYHQQYPL